jgi:hypothetical protein
MEKNYIPALREMTETHRQLTGKGLAEILHTKDKGGRTMRDRAIEELGYWVDIEPWTEEEIRIQEWILRLALESLD